MAKNKKIFLKFYNLLFSSAAEIWPKTKKIFLKFNNIALSRDMAKNKKIFLKFNNIALCAEIWPKTKKIFLKFYNVALCGNKKMHTGLFDIVRQLKKCIRHCAAFKIDEFGPIWSILFSSEAEIWPKNEKNIFEILQRSIPRYGQKQKNILKFYNVALSLCGIKRCIRAYSEAFIFTSSRDMAKKQKKIFLKFNNIALCDMAKKQKKIFLKFNNIALCGNQNRCNWAYSELFIFIRSRDMAKKQKKIFLKFNNIALCGIKNR
ncbi:hypothetical protein PUN28_009740 [Cardiocondyla obscurior]|uniref:Uncharacterized protein n=1 Tax=Cardiocondyla obscurior TaxID=286306 RepID=A0AAW2FK76_9HYME